MLRNTHNDWGSVSKGLHWLIAILIAVQMVLGVYASDLKRSPLKIDMFVWHKSIGMTILLLVAIRLAWRLTSVTPHLETSPVQRALARFTHWSLYALLLLLPLSGWLISSAAGIPLKLFWLVPIPPIAGPSDSLEEWAEGVHHLGITLMLALLAVHVLAALWHHFVVGDNILRRMWFGDSRD